MQAENRILVYQRHGGAWAEAIAAYKAQGLLLGKDVFTRRERCYKGPELCREVWVESVTIATDYKEAGVINAMGH